MTKSHRILIPSESNNIIGTLLRTITKNIVLKHPQSYIMGILGGEFGYGAEWDSKVFTMHPYCWCERDECEYCNETKPNFHHKASGLKIWWDKYIGRSMECENIPDLKDIPTILADCLTDIGPINPENIPPTLTSEQTIEAYRRTMAKIELNTIYSHPHQDTLRNEFYNSELVKNITRSARQMMNRTSVQSGMTSFLSLEWFPISEWNEEVHGKTILGYGKCIGSMSGEFDGMHSAVVQFNENSPTKWEINPTDHYATYMEVIKFIPMNVLPNPSE